MAVDPYDEPVLITADSWANHEPGVDPRPSATGSTFPADFALRELRLVDVDDGEALAAFQHMWGWSGGDPPHGSVLLDVLGGDGYGAPYLDDFDRMAVKGSRVVRVQTLRERIVIARAVVDVVQAFVMAEHGGGHSSAQPDRVGGPTWVGCQRAWRDGLAPIAASLQEINRSSEDWWWTEGWEMYWLRELQAGLNTVPAGMVTVWGEQVRPARVSWYAVVCVEMAAALASLDLWHRCANERAHAADGVWFTQKRTRRRAGHGTPHKVGLSYCSDNCEKAATERERRRRRRADTARSNASPTQSDARSGDFE